MGRRSTRRRRRRTSEKVAGGSFCLFPSFPRRDVEKWGEEISIYVYIVACVHAYLCINGRRGAGWDSLFIHTSSIVTFYSSLSAISLATYFVHSEPNKKILRTSVICVYRSRVFFSLIDINIYTPLHPDARDIVRIHVNNNWVILERIAFTLYFYILMILKFSYDP